VGLVVRVSRKFPWWRVGGGNGDVGGDSEDRNGVT
jgi:hypothetical protein